VRVAGTTIPVDVWATERERRTILYRLPRLEEGRGLLLAWPRNRYIKIDSESSPATYDVLFLDRSGRVLELAGLREGDPEGVMSRVEAAAALLVSPGRVSAKTGDQAELSPPTLLSAASDLPLVRIGGAEARVELALSEADRQHGLMFRPRMSADDGMLFAYREEGMHRFWMGNTLIPLDIAFFAADGRCLNVNETPMYPDPRHPPGNYRTSDSAGPARFVLEMNLGWFRKKGLLDPSGKPLPGLKIEVPLEAVRGRFD
jgi:uncharacterized membrane protein (UPF0127 family)